MFADTSNVRNLTSRVLTSRVLKSSVPMFGPVLFVVCFLSTAATVLAQPVSLSGSAGLSAKGYSASGIAERKAPAALEAFARVSFDLAGLTSGVNLTYSTDQSGVRQSINKFAFKTAWKSGSIEVGDVSANYSPYSLSGVTTRGGSIEQHAGPMYIAFAGGRSRRAVDVSRLESFRGASFTRYVFGTRFGAGDPSGSHFHLIAVYGKDRENSLEEPGDLTPAANVSLTPSFALSLFGKALKLTAQVTGSVYTSDYTETIETDTALPAFAKEFVTEGSQYDFAGNFALAFQRPDYGFAADFTRVQPGFRSLGLSQIRSDEQTIRFAPRFRLLNGRLNFTGSVGRTQNNLYQTLLTTLTRDQASAAIQAQVSRQFGIAASANVLSNVSDPTPGSPATAAALQQKQIGSSFMVAPTLLLQSAAGTSQTLSVSGARQSFEDRSDAVLDGTRMGFNSTNNSLTAVYSLRFPSSLSVTLTGNLVASDATTSDANIRNANLAVGYRPLATLNATVSGGWSASTIKIDSGDVTTEQTGTQWNGGLTMSWSVTRAAAVRLQIRGVANRSDASVAFGDYEEIQSTLSFTQRF